MSEEQTAPAFYPDFDDADRWKNWDGSREARMWADLLRVRDRVIVESAAAVMGTREGADVGGIMIALWSLTGDEIAGVVQANMGQITRKSKES